MQYKTITLELLESFPEMALTLKSADRFLAALEACSTDLRTRHLSLMDLLCRTNPQTGTEELSSRAFEIALQELEARIQFAGQPATLAHPDQLIEYLRRHTPPE